MIERPSFPRLSARTHRFTLGEPRTITVTADGERVLFVRTSSGTDRVGALREFHVPTGTERLLADPTVLLGDGGEQLSAAERARRERSRESAAGVVGYSVDDAGDTAAFALSGAVWVCDLAGADARALPTTGAVIDPRIDPTGRRIAYAADGALRVIDVDGTNDRALVEPDGVDPSTVVWGQAEFVATEEMDRTRGFWWSPDGESLLVERYDVAPVPTWHLADPADPAATPAPHRYPVAGGDNAEVSLWHIDLDGVRRLVLSTDGGDQAYLTRVWWSSAGAVVQVMSRDQRRVRILRPNLERDSRRDSSPRPAGSEDQEAVACRLLAERTDPTWIELMVGVPRLVHDGRLLAAADDTGCDTRRLTLDGEPITPPGKQIRAVLDVSADGALVQYSGGDPTTVAVAGADWDGRWTELSDGPGMHSAAAGGGTLVVLSAGLDRDGVRGIVRRDGRDVGVLSRAAASPGFVPTVTLLRAGQRELATAVLFPRGHAAGSARLPVLMAPYGGPHGQLVVQQRRGFLQPQYLADQGFCVVVADGRGTPGRGPAWEKSIRDDLVVTLEDQVEALTAVAERYPDDVDASRTGFIGWSYGGYLAALSVLARPDVFRAAVAGAPVADWELYDTFYTERYLGHPGEQPGVYRRNSLLAMAGAERPSATGGPDPELLIVHGLADDNVVVAHSLRLSSALLGAGRPHAVLPLTGITHMPVDEGVAENLLRLQVDFLRGALAVPGA